MDKYYFFGKGGETRTFYNPTNENPFLGIEEYLPARVEAIRRRIATSEHVASLKSSSKNYDSVERAFTFEGLVAQKGWVADNTSPCLYEYEETSPRII